MYSKPTYIAPRRLAIVLHVRWTYHNEDRQGFGYTFTHCTKCKSCIKLSQMTVQDVQILLVTIWSILVMTTVSLWRYCSQTNQLSVSVEKTITIMCKDMLKFFLAPRVKELQHLILHLTKGWCSKTLQLSCVEFLNKNISGCWIGWDGLISWPPQSTYYPFWLLPLALHEGPSVSNMHTGYWHPTYLNHTLHQQCNTRHVSVYMDRNWILTWCAHASWGEHNEV
jgi:hypothetical protein